MFPRFHLQVTRLVEQIKDLTCKAVDGPSERASLRKAAHTLAELSKAGVKPMGIHDMRNHL